jgi:hypothetical protein
MLHTISIPSSVTSIGGATFIRCYALASITIPDSVTSIGSSAFYTCTSLVSINIPNSVTSIGNGAFLGCTSLTSVTIGNGVTRVEESAFDGCTNLGRIIFFGNAPQFSPWPLPIGQIITVYYFAGTTGWGPTFAGLTTVQLTTPAVQSLVFNVNGNAQLSWSAMQGAVYEIQSTDSLDNPFVTRSIQTASNTVETWNEPNSSIPSKRFYRVNMRLP